MDKRNLSISAIVPVYNEERTVGDVVKILLESSAFSEVICVNDGSSDKSEEILSSFLPRIKLINLQKNYGKGYALAVGVENSKGLIVGFFDADILSLTTGHIHQLLDPVISRRAKAVIGISNSASFSNLFFRNLSGERVYYKKDVFPLLSRMKRSRFGVEVLLNKELGKVTVPVYLDGFKLLLKYQKYSTTQAISEYLREAKEIILTFPDLYKVPYFEKLEKVLKAKNLKEFTGALSKLDSKISAYQEFKKYLEDYFKRTFKS